MKYGNEVTWIIHDLNEKIFCCCAYCCHEAVTLINLFLMRNKVRFSIAQKITMLNLNCRLRAWACLVATHNKRFNAIKQSRWSSATISSHFKDYTNRSDHFFIIILRSSGKNVENFLLRRLSMLNINTQHHITARSRTREIKWI